jgi:tetratricopeptide (TPR) repeat protein
LGVRFYLLVLALFGGAVRAQEVQSSSDQKRLEEAFRRINEFLRDGRTQDAEQLMKETMPTPAFEPQKQTGDLKISLYGFFWTRILDSYLESDDYPNAERVSMERIGVAEKFAGPNQMQVAVYLDLAAQVYLTEAKYEAALPLLRRSLQIHAASKMDTAIIAAPVYLGLAEALLAQGKAKEARDVLKPVIERSRIGVVERQVFNAYAVVLGEIGDTDAAARIEQDVEKALLVRDGVNAQERDFLKARVLAARGAPDEAEAIYRKWIQHWEEWGERVRSDPKEREWDRILMDPLREYHRFLVLQKRDREADAVRQRLVALKTKYAHLPQAHAVDR